MNLWKNLAVTFVLFCFTLPAHATDGVELFSEYESLQRILANPIKDEESVSAGAYLGYVSGVVETLDAMGINCTPHDITLTQIGDLLGKFLKDHSTERQQDGPLLIIKFLQQLYPCKQKQN
jgi:hypothetical protein